MGQDWNSQDGLGKSWVSLKSRAAFSLGRDNLACNSVCLKALKEGRRAGVLRFATECVPEKESDGQEQEASALETGRAERKVGPGCGCAVWKCSLLGWMCFGHLAAECSLPWFKRQ